MDLFNQTDEIQNLLPQNGIANHHGFVFSRAEADELYNSLLQSIAWKNDEVMMYGKYIITKRKVAWYGENPSNYSYPNISGTALPFTQELLAIKRKVEIITNENYNACLLNLYHNGSEGLSWHSDDEDCFKKNGAIASITLGAERKFAFKHKSTNKVVSLILQHGSLLLMKGETQIHWLHSLPPTKKVNKPRINLTFRTMVS